MDAEMSTTPSPSPDPPFAQISPDSRSSELERERRSRSNDSDRSRSLSLALSVGGDTSLSTQSLSSAFSSRHPSSGGTHSLSRVWDDLSLEDLWENAQSSRRVTIQSTSKKKKSFLLEMGNW